MSKEVVLAFLIQLDAYSTTVVYGRPDDIEVDLDKSKWWQTKWNDSDDPKAPNWRGEYQIGTQIEMATGRHRLFYVYHLPGEVIGVYDLNDPDQLLALERDAQEAEKKEG